MAKKKRIAIILPARLVVCPDCGLHAHIVLSDGTKSDECYSAQKLAGFLENAVNAKNATLEEAECIAKQILDSRLSPLDESESRVALATAIGLREALATSDEELATLCTRPQKGYVH